MGPSFVSTFCAIRYECSLNGPSFVSTFCAIRYECGLNGPLISVYVLCYTI